MDAIFTSIQHILLLCTATLKQISDDPSLIQERSQQIEERRSQYQWKDYPKLGLPSSVDEAIPILDLIENFHRAKLVNFLSNVFKGVVFTGDITDTALEYVDGIIEKALGMDNVSFKSANQLYVFEQLPQQLTIDEAKNRNPKADISAGFEIEICHVARWATDEEFGRQILNGVNPIVIRRCSALPDNFPVTHDMVKNSLVRNMTLQEEMKV